MAETFSMSEFTVPGVFVRVRAEGLISVGGISTGNIGIVGTAGSGVGATHLLGDYEGAVATFGAYDAYAAGAGARNLTRSLEQLFRNGARTIYAHGVAEGASVTDFNTAFTEIAKENVQIVVAPELGTTDALAVLGPVLETGENDGKDMIAVVGTDTDVVANVAQNVPDNDRIVYVAPGIRAFDSAADGGDGAWISLPGTYAAAAVAGLFSTLTPNTSPTNKGLAGVVELSQRFSYSEIRQLVSSRAMVLEQRAPGDVRVVRGLTSDSGAFTQVTTRRITDFAKAGIRQASDPFIGKLNNERVRKALYGAIDGFLTTMVVDEHLITYTLQVTASRADQIAGRCLVNVVMQPVFSIDFIAVTLVLE